MTVKVLDYLNLGNIHKCVVEQVEEVSIQKGMYIYFLVTQTIFRKQKKLDQCYKIREKYLKVSSN